MVDELEVWQVCRLAVCLDREVAAVHGIQQKLLRIGQSARAVFFCQIGEVFRQINAEHEGAAGAARNHGQTGIAPLTKGLEVMLCIGAGVLPKAVGNHGQAAAHQFFGHNNLVASAVHGPHHIKAGAGVIHVHIAAGVKHHAALEVWLVNMVHELAEGLRRKGGQGRAFVDAKGIKHGPRYRVEHAKVLDGGGDKPQPLGHEFAVPKHPVAQTGRVFFELVGPCHHVEA